MQPLRRSRATLPDGRRDLVPPVSDRVRRPALLLALVAASALACSPLPPTDPPPTFLLSWLDAHADLRSQEFERKQGRVRLESPYLSGTYSIALIRRRGDDPAVRLQLYPELGGRVLDLSATASSFAGLIPPADVAVAWESGAGKQPRHFFTCLAASLMEEGRALSSERALGAAPGPEKTWRVQLTPAFEGLEVVARFDPYGVIDRMEYSLRGVEWIEEPRRADRERRFVGLDFELVFLEEMATPTGPLSDALFHLDAGRDAAGGQGAP